MAREIIPSILTGSYVPDRGGAIDDFSFRFGKPADLSDTVVDAVLAAVGARRKTALDRTPCPVASEFTGRKLKFVRKDGNSLSLVLPDRANAITAATAVKAAIDAANGDNKVLCIELQGEEWTELMLELSSRAGAPTAGTPSRSPSTGGKQYAHSGKILYRYDGGAGKTQTIAVKVDTDIVGPTGNTQPPTILGGSWTSCVGTYENSSPCPSASFITHRRYLATLLTSGDPLDPLVPQVYQTSEVPVKNAAAADILACGQAVANLASTVCLRYKGETNNRLHLLLP
jgi:hypothetical protein